MIKHEISAMSVKTTDLIRYGEINEILTQE